MGTFNVTIHAGDPARTRFEPVEALVDTGASYTMLPAALLRRLDVPGMGRRPFVLASGGLRTKEVGQTWIRIDGREVMTVVVFGDDGGPALLGAVTLEEFGLDVDPLGQKLIEVPGLLT
ncbi:MAG: retroviral-like aspartic protease family protein [Chloroflexota bacterium]|nr:retroviral-like aspartic protease family protein [Chloroflexota bacterium]